MNSITHFKYSMTKRELTFFCDDHSIILCKPIPHFVHGALLKSDNATAFFHKYIEYDLNFQKLYIN